MNTEVFVGLDVNRLTLEISVRPTGENWSTTVDDEGICGIAEKLRDIHPDIVVLEARGGPELPVAGTLASAGLPFALISPRSIRDFAKVIGGVRQDRTQAGLLAHYAELVRPEVRYVAPELVQQLQGLKSRRIEVLNMLALEQSRVDVAVGPVQRDIRNHMQFLEKSVALIDDEISRSVRVSGRLFAS